MDQARFIAINTGDKVICFWSDSCKSWLQVKMTVDMRLTGRPPTASKIEIIRAKTLAWSAVLLLAIGGIMLIRHDFDWQDLQRSFQP